MIAVTYHRRAFCLTIRGHAGAGQKGRDLVCCAVSMLAHTLGENLRQMERHGRLRGCVILLEEGRGDIRCVPQPQFQGVCTLVFDTVVTGLKLLARDYPAHVKIDVV